MFKNLIGPIILIVAISSIGFYNDAVSSFYKKKDLDSYLTISATNDYSVAQFEPQGVVEIAFKTDESLAIESIVN